ncbi:MAG: hypothetical protein KOO66_12140 [Bacteroidales bacterium]|nr:hypothetical protein [Bacteroidales bacterium]
MKTKKYFWMLMMVFAVFAVSCDKEEDAESCDSEDLAEDFNCPVDVDAIATFCADGVNDSYYTYNGTDYYCTGVEASTCDGAIAQVGIALIEAGCGTKKKSAGMENGLIKLSQMAENLLAEVRTESLYD